GSPSTPHVRGVSMLIVPQPCLSDARPSCPLSTATMSAGNLHDAHPHGTPIVIPTESPTLHALLRLYEQEYLPHQAPNTQIGKRPFFRHLDRVLGSTPLPDLPPGILRQWRDSMASRLKPGSVRRYMLILSSVLTVAVKDYELLPRNPLAKVKKP